MHYNRPDKTLQLAADKLHPWFEKKLRNVLIRDESWYVSTVPSSIKLIEQNPNWFNTLPQQSRDFQRNPASPSIPMGINRIQKTRVGLLVDATMEATYNTNNTLFMNLLFSTLADMTEVTCIVFGQTGRPTETIPIPTIHLL